MKDKLTKHHKRANSYTMKRVLIALSVVLLLSAAIVIPVSISVYTSTISSAINLIF